MSIPHTTFTCDQCDFTASNIGIWGRFLYQLPGGSLVHFKRTSGWCFDCKTIVPVEDLDQEWAKKKLEGLKGDLYRKQEELYALESKKRGLFTRWFVSKARLKRIQETVDYFHKEIGEAFLYVNILSSRRSPPRCLVCSQTNTTSFVI